MTSDVALATVGMDYGGVTADVAAAYPCIGLATDALRNAHPEFSAAMPMPRWQRIAAAALAFAIPSALLAALQGSNSAFAVLVSAPFLTISVIRMAALRQCLRQDKGAACDVPVLKDDALPTYSVLVPLYREREIAPRLVEALGRLDYPIDKLDIVFATEADDPATRAALSAAVLQSHMHVLTVPTGVPKTKPRALNYALQSARGALVCVFDAEDVPDPRQLRLAAESFAVASDNVACLQARIGIYNADQGFLPRQFALEYAALFEAILPVLERHGLPIPLGGTSNHFRRAALEVVGAWDAYNVTEDADLGFRLARHGLRVTMLASDTWEEAPENWRDWRGQRTRWHKGWMQTYLVLMRRPAALVRELGYWRAAGVQVLLGGMILSALIHPWFYGAAAVAYGLGQPVFGAAGVCNAICWLTFVSGYASGIALGLVAARRSQGRIPLLSALLVPVYWLAISFAAYRALWQLRTRPFFWEKTPHVARPVAAKPARAKCDGA